MATESVVSQGGSLLDGDRYLSPKSLIAEYPPRVFDRSGSRRRWIPASTVRSTESVILLPRISLFFSMAQGILVDPDMATYRSSRIASEHALSGFLGFYCRYWAAAAEPISYPLLYL